MILPNEMLDFNTCTDNLVDDIVNFKGEVSPGILCSLGEWRMILETKQQKFGQIWIIQSRDMIFQRFH